MKAKHLRQILKLASQLVKILKIDPEVSKVGISINWANVFCREVKQKDLRANKH